MSDLLKSLKSKVSGDIQELNRLLVEVSERLEQKVLSHEIVESLQGRIIHALFRKAVRTARAIESLKAAEQVEEAWILVRVLLETHVNFFYFMRKDPAEMTRRYLDWTLLDKLKHLREVNFYEGTAMESVIERASYESNEKEIQARYSQAELRELKQHGFTGCAFEARSKTVGLVSMYTYCYRIASRNIHAFDPAETLVHKDILSDAFTQDLLQARRITLESFQNMLLGRFAYSIGEVIGEPFLEQLTLIGIGYEKFRDENNIGVGSDEPLRGSTTNDDDALFIWRE